MSEKVDDGEIIEETIEKLHKLMMDPTRVAIWFEILRTPDITAKELMKVINIKKTAMYYHLSLLEEEKVIDFTLDGKEKNYHIKLNFFDLFMEKQSKQKVSGKNIDLFFLFLINSFVQKEIIRVSNTAEENYKPKKYPVQRTGMWFCTEEKLEQIKEEYQQLWEKIKEIDQGEEPDMIAHTPLVYFWGLSIFEE